MYIYTYIYIHISLACVQMEARLHASTTLKVRRLRFRGGMHASRNLHPAHHFQCFFVSRSSLRHPLGESERPSIIDQAMNRRGRARQPLARYRSDDERVAAERNNRLFHEGLTVTADWSVARSVGRWASVLLASSSGDTNVRGIMSLCQGPTLPRHGHR